jgi:L-malate glycosyltransferase
MKDKPVILIVENSIQVTGSFNAIIRSVSLLTEKYRFVFIIPRHSGIKTAMTKNGFQFYELNFKEIRKSIYSLLIYFPFLIANAFRLKKIARNLSADLVHVNDIYNMVPALARIFGMKTKIVSHVRFMPDRFPKWLFKVWWFANQYSASLIIVVSHAAAQFLPSSRKIRVIYDPLPVSTSLPLPTSRIHEEVNFLYLSNYIPGKGQEYALQAFYLASRIIPKIRIKFVGSDMGLEKNKAFKMRLVKESASLSLSNSVQWEGFSERIIDEILEADVVLNFSDSESLSLTCIEAMYCGKPLIATASGGPQEFIEHLKSGYIVPVANIKAMTEAMISLASDIKLSQDLALGAYYSIRKKLSPEETVGKLAECYDIVLKAP